MQKPSASGFLIPVAEFPTPSLNSVRRYLRSIGAVQLPGGKGDHEKWRLSDGTVIILNAAKRNRKDLDFGSLKSIAKALGKDIAEMTEAINAA